ncbi:hypothetical protein [Desertivirga arenae]|uniref:hypothetical protein n=1 Tax=Desertivirga arenae TaxID=2810309 RepID=UPI001A96567A|nr:hypothetical protein [Pedobacter sp. SYSU D00823]
MPYSTGVSIDREKNEIIIELADYFNRKRLTPVFQISQGASVTSNGIKQQSGTSSNDFTRPAIYKVISESGRAVDWMIKVESNDSKIGLRGTMEAQNRLERDYEWYYAQDSSGVHSSINGGAAVVAMAARWTHRTNFVSYGVLQAREEASPQYRLDGTLDVNPQPFSTLDVTSLLTKKEIPWKVVPLSPELTDIINCIDKGYLVILVINFSHIQFNQSLSDHTHGYYTIPTAVYPHYIIVKGYKRVSGSLFFECYDPKSDGKRYSNNGEIKGRNRYYSASDLWAGAADERGWRYAVVVGSMGNAMPGLLNEVRMSQITQGTGY